MTQKRYCFGKKAAIFDSRTLRFGAYLTAALRAPPDAVNWGKNVKSWTMYLNDKYADCTCAAAGHMIKNWSAAAGKEKRPTDKQILKFYEHFTTPGPENIAQVLDVPNTGAPPDWPATRSKPLRSSNCAMWLKQRTRYRFWAVAISASCYPNLSPRRCAGENTRLG